MALRHVLPVSPTQEPSAAAACSGLECAEPDTLREASLQELAFPGTALRSQPGNDGEGSGGSRGALNPDADADADDDSSQAIGAGARLLAWAQECSKTVTLLSRLSEQRDLPPGGREWPLQLSLVKLQHDEPEVVLVAWRFAGKSGRIIDLDTRNKVVATNPRCREFNCDVSGAHRSSQVLMPLTGVCPHRQRLADRPDLPADALRLKAAFANGSRNACESLSLDACHICGVGGLVPGPGNATAARDDGDHGVLVCAFCLQSVHLSCANRAAAQASPSETKAMLDVPEDMLSQALAYVLHHFSPANAGGTCCQLCMTALGAPPARE